MRGFHGLLRFLGDTRGNLAIIMALTILPVMIGFGVAIDLQRLSMTKTEFDQFADYAAMQSVDYTAMKGTASAAQAAGVAAFNGLAQNDKNATVKSITVAINDGVSQRSVTVSYQVSIKPTFTSLIGYQTLTVSGTSKASSATNIYLDAYVLADNTPSMGLAATTADQQRFASVNSGCTFACHDLRTAGADTTILARNNNITLRIDALANAVQDLLTTAQATNARASGTPPIRFALYNFGSKMGSDALTNIFALSSNLTDGKTAAAGMTLMSWPTSYTSDSMATDFKKMFTALNTAVPAPGDGSTPSSPKKLVLLISDGEQDYQGTTGCLGLIYAPSSRCLAPIDPSLCNLFKNRGISVGVLYTTYLPASGDWTYNNLVAPYNQGPWAPSPNSKIANNMKACASAGLFQEVGPNDDISGALNTILSTYLAQYARITN